MTAREEILNRVRAALRSPTDQAVRARLAPPAAKSALPQFRPYLPTVPDEPEGRRALFIAQLESLRAEFLSAPTIAELPQIMDRLGKCAGWDKIAAHRAGLVDAACSGTQFPLFWVDRAATADELATCSVGITACAALVAQTGSIVLACRTCGGRALSVLPPHHVVIAGRSQLVADLCEAYALLIARFGQDLPSFTTFVTGPSRTGDIEHVVVLGAHGPKRLTVILIENE